MLQFANSGHFPGLRECEKDSRDGWNLAASGAGVQHYFLWKLCPLPLPLLNFNTTFYSRNAANDLRSVREIVSDTKVAALESSSVVIANQATTRRRYVPATLAALCFLLDALERI